MAKFFMDRLIYILGPKLCLSYIRSIKELNEFKNEDLFVFEILYLKLSFSVHKSIQVNIKNDRITQ